MQHSTDELFTIFFSTVFESSTISSFAQKIASFFKRYMPVSTLYFCFYDKNKLFKIAEYINHTGIVFPDQLTIPEDTLKRLHREEHFFSGALYAIKNFTGEENCVFAEYRNSIFKNVESSGIYIPINTMWLKTFISIWPSSVSERTDIHRSISTSARSCSR